MENNHQTHIIPYSFYLIILFLLISFTLISVFVTTIELGGLATFTAMSLAAFKSILVLLYFMHLKFDQGIFKIMFFIVLAIFIAVIFITMIDYIYR